MCNVHSLYGSLMIERFCALSVPRKSCKSTKNHEKLKSWYSFFGSSFLLDQKRRISRKHNIYETAFRIYTCTVHIFVQHIEVYNSMHVSVDIVFRSSTIQHTHTYYSFDMNFSSMHRRKVCFVDFYHKNGIFILCFLFFCSERNKMELGGFISRITFFLRPLCTRHG